MAVVVEIKGLEKALSRLNLTHYAGPIKDFFNRSSITVADAYRESVAVDTGRGKASITHEVDNMIPPQWAKVGTNVLYMAYLESGTGDKAEGEPRKGGEHRPPSGALDVWAGRHGMASGYVVARAIGEEGGLEPRWWLRDAFNDSMAAIGGFVNQLKSDIASRWG